MALSDAACKLLLIVSANPGISLPDACEVLGGDIGCLGSTISELSNEIATDGARDLAHTRLWLTAEGCRRLSEAKLHCNGLARDGQQLREPGAAPG